MFKPETTQSPSTASSKISPELSALFDTLGKAPETASMSELETIQKHGEYIHSRFPEKHEFQFHLGQGLELRGHSDTWVNPPSVGMYISLNGTPISAEARDAFNERTGRDLYSCVLNEVQRRLVAGEVTKTPRQELVEAMKDLTPGHGLEHALHTINRLVDDASASKLKVAGDHYNQLKGQGFILNVSDKRLQIPYSCVHPGACIAIGVSDGFRGPVIELGERDVGTGSFRSSKTIEGEPAQALLAKVKARSTALQAKLEAEGDFISEHLPTAVTAEKTQGWHTSSHANAVGVYGKIGNFDVSLSAPEKSHFDGIACVYDPKCTVFTSAAPRHILRAPLQANSNAAFDKIFESQLEPIAVRESAFTQESPIARVLLEKVAAHLSACAPDKVKKFYPDWHAHSTTLGGDRWEIDATKDGNWPRSELFLVSSEGISVGCWRGGRSGGYAEAFLLNSPQAKTLAAEALGKIEGFRQGGLA